MGDDSQGIEFAKRAVAVCAAVLLVSSGLCGLNFVAARHSSGSFLIFTAFLEVAGILGGAIGLLIALANLARVTIQQRRGK